MTPAENLTLWKTNRAAWIEAAAPKCAEYLATGRAAIEHAWPILARDFQLAVWPLLDDATKAIVREVARAAELSAQDAQSINAETPK